MAKTPKVPPERYKRVAKTLAPLSPKIAKIAKKKSLSAADKRAITRAENKAHEWSAGTQRLIPLSAKDVKNLKDKSLLVPGFNAVVDRNLGRTPTANVSEGELYINDNGRRIHVINADSSNKEKFAEIGEKLFKGKKRNVWVRFANGRSDRAFTDKEALLRFLVKVWEQYTPDWNKEGLSVDQMMIGFEVYEAGKGPVPKKPKSKKRTVKPTKKKPSKVGKAIKKLVKRRLKKQPIAKMKPVKKTKKFKPVKQTKLKKAKPVTRNRGTSKRVKTRKKNRRYRL